MNKNMDMFGKPHLNKYKIKILRLIEKSYATYIQAGSIKLIHYATK